MAKQLKRDINICLYSLERAENNINLHVQSSMRSINKTDIILYIQLALWSNSRKTYTMCYMVDKLKRYLKLYI